MSMMVSSILLVESHQKCRKFPGLEIVDSGVIIEFLYFLRTSALRHMILSVVTVECYMVQHFGCRMLIFTLDWKFVLTNVDTTREQQSSKK